MSLKGSATPLRIDLGPSRYHRWLIYGSHLLTAALVLVLSRGQPRFLLATPLLLLSLAYYRHDYLAKTDWRQLRCYRDGRVECLATDGTHDSFLLQHPPFISHWMVILPLRRGKRRRYLPLFVDSMPRRQWLDLRRFLRYSLD